MSLFYQQLSPMLMGQQREESSSGWKWVTRVHSWLPRRKKDELQEFQVKPMHPLTSSLLFAINTEVGWWVETNVTEYTQSRRFVLPEVDRASLESKLAWKMYWIEVKQRVVPPLIKYQGTLLVVEVLKRSLSVLVSHETFLKCIQHPPRRAIAISERESDRLMIGMEVLVVSIWANWLFFSATYIVSQARPVYQCLKEYGAAIFRRSSRLDADYLNDVMLYAYQEFLTTGQRYLYSSLGAGVASMVWPGWGTLFGSLLGERYAPTVQVSDTHLQFLSKCSDLGHGVFETLRSIGALFHANPPPRDGKKNDTKTQEEQQQQQDANKKAGATKDHIQ